LIRVNVDAAFSGSAWDARNTGVMSQTRERPVRPGW
jgi:hypothetical protein